LAKERAQGQICAAEVQVQAAAALAAEKVEAAAHAADIRAQATAALTAKKTRASAEAADLRAVNDMLLAQVAAAERCAEIEREHAQRVAEWMSVGQEATPTQPDGQVQQMHWLVAKMHEMQQPNLQKPTPAEPGRPERETDAPEPLLDV
jgi:hypothetical protein